MMRSLRTRHVSTSPRSVFLSCDIKLVTARLYQPEAKARNSAVKFWGNPWTFFCKNQTQPQGPRVYSDSVQPANTLVTHDAETEKNQADTHHLHLLEFILDRSHLSADDQVIVCDVQPQQVIVDQPQHHVTCKLCGFLGQLRNLVVRELVQFVLIVQFAAHIWVDLAGGGGEQHQLGSAGGQGCRKQPSGPS